MAKKFKVIGCCIVASILSLITACEKDIRPLRISINAWPGYEFLYLAEQKDFFKDEGVDVQLVQLGSLSDTRRAFERNKVDGMAATLIEVVQGNDESERVPQVVLVSDYSNGADFILSQPEIKNVKQLKGKRVGLELGSLGVFMLVRMLEHSGLTINDVEIVSSAQSSMEAMFNDKKIDAVVTYPPVAFSLLNNKGTNILFTSADIPGEIIDVIAIDREVVRTSPEKVAGLIRGFYRAVDYAMKNPEESYKIMAEREGISAGEFKTALESGVHIVMLNEQYDYFYNKKLSKEIASVEKVLRDTGQIDKKIALDELENSEPLKMLGALVP